MFLFANFIHKHRVLSELVGVILLGIIFGVALPVTSFGSSDQKQPVKEQGWSYTLTTHNSSLDEISINYDTSTSNGVEAYAAAMRRESDQLYQSKAVSTIAATSIVFNHPLTWDEADALVKKYGLVATGYEFRGVNSADANDRSTFDIGVARNGQTGQGFNDSDKQLLNSMIDTINRSNVHHVVIKGIIGIQADLTYPQYQSVNTSPDIYVVEMPRQIIKSKLMRKAIPNLSNLQPSNVNINDINLADINVNYVPGPLYRHLEDLHMVKAN
jgi:hypothetical protein